MTAHDPLEADEKLKLILPGQPFLGWHFQFADPISAALSLPGAYVILQHFSIAHPHFCPLDPVGHHVVTITAINHFQWIFKFVRWVKGL